MIADKDYVNYLRLKKEQVKTPCPLACAFEFMQSRSTANGSNARLSEQAAKIKQKVAGKKNPPSDNQ